MNQHASNQRGRSRIVYQFHPYFGREVNVIRGIRAGEEPAIIADVGEDTRIMIPSWMFDENCCRMVIIEDRPRVSVDALLRLRVLLEAHDPTPVGEEDKHRCTEENEDSQT